jgi:hypothetical protein
MPNHKNRKLLGYTTAVYVKPTITMNDSQIEDGSILQPGIVFVEPQLTEDETRQMAWEVARRNAATQYPPPFYNPPRVVVSAEPTHTKLGNTVEYMLHIFKKEETN